MIDEKEGEEKSLSGGKLFFIVPLVIIFVFVFVTMFYFSGPPNISKSFSCGDGTPSGGCSADMPYFCDNGKLIEKAGFCGCPESLIPDGDFCISKYETNPQNITLNYVLDGKKREMNFVVYKGMVDYLSNLSRVIHYSGGAQPTRQDFKLKDINEPEQKELLLPLVKEIQNAAEDKTDQARIAISLVQKIPFGQSDKTISLGNGGPQVEYSRYPYEVLYDMEGVCGEKSELLSFLLKELGYGTGIFYYRLENHEAVGIKCPAQYGVDKTGYCFVETSAPSIITNNQLEYVGGVELLSTPELILISNGSSLGDMPEYKDASNFLEIEKKLEETGKIGYLEDFKLNHIEKKYGLNGGYNI